MTSPITQFLQPFVSSTYKDLNLLTYFLTQIAAPNLHCQPHFIELPMCMSTKRILDMPKSERVETDSGNEASSGKNNFKVNDDVPNDKNTSPNEETPLQPNQAIVPAYVPRHYNPNAFLPVHPYNQSHYYHPHMSISTSSQMMSNSIQQQETKQQPLVPGYPYSYPNYLQYPPMQYPPMGMSYPPYYMPYQHAPFHMMMPSTGAFAAMPSPATHKVQPERIFLSKTLKFPELLYRMLMDAERESDHSDAMSFLPHGRAFKIHKKEKFEQIIMPKYFPNNNWKSFRRQINLYDFIRISNSGPDDGAYYHNCLLRGRPDLLPLIVRTKIKGGASKNLTTNTSASVPDFYSMKPISPPPQKKVLSPDEDNDEVSPERKKGT